MPKTTTNGYTVKLGTDYTGEVRVRADGVAVAVKRVTIECQFVDCQRPDRKFTCEITTKPPSYCPACQKVATTRSRAADQAKYKRRKAAGLTAGPKKKLIRYAGWDGSK